MSKGAKKPDAARECECERNGLCIEIYYVDNVCVVCGGVIKKNYKDYWWK